jgi:hypothetical protein
METSIVKREIRDIKNNGIFSISTSFYLLKWDNSLKKILKNPEFQKTHLKWSNITKGELRTDYPIQ